MRIFAAIMIWVIIISTVTAFEHFRGGQLPELTEVSHESSMAISDRVFRLELTPTFDAEPDPFALNLDNDPASVLSVKIGERVLLDLAELAAAELPIVVDNISGFAVGSNEVYIESTPPVADSPRRHAILAELYSDGNLVVSETIWSQMGGKVAGVLVFDISESEAEHGH